MKHINKIMILLLLTALNSVSNLAIANAEEASVTRVSTAENNPVSVKQLELDRAITAYELSLTLNITFDELNRINNGNLKSDELLAVGRKIAVPQGTNIDTPKDITALETKTESVLPSLGGQTKEQNTILEKALSYTPANQYIGGSTEENVANVLNTAATEDWEQFGVKDIVDNAETQLKNQVKGQITGKITDAAKGILGRFGKAEVNLSVDENGNIEGSSLNVLSPIVDTESSLLFSQIGVHGQGSGDDARTIGNFGLGYRYEQEEWLAGGNVFIDHDFTGSNTRLGLGSEYWRNNFKLSTNVYTPLSGWKESAVMKNYEALIYDERAARGFDVRAQGYLPSYPQLGGSLVYEQYFGDEVALFSTEKRQQDPYALTVGFDYTPIPLITSKISHKVGKDGQNDTRFDLNLNLQLGTPIEQQLDPANVAVARSLKGSRYDMVDRNYDIVFEYKKEDFSVKIDGPTTTMLGTEVTVYPIIQSRAEIASYEWFITDALGTIIPKGNNNSREFTFRINDYIDHYIRLKVKTVRGYEATSEPLKISVVAANSKSTLVTTDDNKFAKIIDFSALPANFGYQDILDLPSDSLKMLTFTAFNSDGELYNLIENPDIIINWRFTGESGGNYRLYDPTNDLIHFEWIQGEQASQLKIVAIADEKFIEKEGGTRSIDIVVSSYTDSTVFAGNSISFINSESSVLPELGIDPNNMKIQIWKLAAVSAFNTSDDLVSESGFINGEPIETRKLNIEQGAAYRVKILTSHDAITNPDSMIDVTDRYVDGIVWLYWDPVNGVEVTSDSNPYVLYLNDETRTYRALEGCRASSTFITQLNNYDFNELAWGDILQDDNKKPRDRRIINEQGLRLAVQFDFTALNEPKDLSTTMCKDNVPNVDKSYLGYENGKQRAVVWSEAE